jgi:hypothetical protein
MATETCSHNHEAPLVALTGLHDSQAGKHRHKCCVCAYHEGYKFGLAQIAQPAGKTEECHKGNTLPYTILNRLPASQAGEGRHKCAICAFRLGLEAGTKASQGTIGLTSDGFGDESKNYQKRARQALPLLVAQAKAKNTITYGQLANQLDMPNPRNLNMVLGAVGSELKALGQEWGEHIPPLTCLVINKQDRTPRRGIGFHMPPEEFEKLSSARQEEMLHLVMSDIWDYERWDDVLRHFSLEPITPAKTEALQKIEKEIKYGRGGGESEDHKRLKKYIKENPEAIGLPKSLVGKVEHMFFSADEIDVLFKSASAWVGVEVKGPYSDLADITRGIFQCVKYKALIEATQRYEQVAVNGRVLLVLGGKLPKELQQTIGLLKIELREDVAVPTSFQPNDSTMST